MTSPRNAGRLRDRPAQSIHGEQAQRLCLFREAEQAGRIMQLSYAQIPRRRVKLMDIQEVFRSVAPQVRDAAVKAADQLSQLGIRHALAGGLAVGAHGYIRATLDVDFLVGEEAFEHQGALVAFKTGVPIAVSGVRIDYLSPASLGPQLEEVLDDPPRNAGLAIVPIEVLIYMKLVANRRKDLLDVVELVKAGADAQRVRDYLQQYAGDLLPLFEELADEAMTE
jgi:hypothetical protein